MVWLDEGALYPALYRLERKGWITAEWRITENNRKAKFYRLTAAGRRCLKTELQDWEAHMAAVSPILRGGRCTIGVFAAEGHPLRPGSSRWSSRRLEALASRQDVAPD